MKSGIIIVGWMKYCLAINNSFFRKDHYPKMMIGIKIKSFIKGIIIIQKFQFHLKIGNIIDRLFFCTCNHFLETHNIWLVMS